MAYLPSFVEYKPPDVAGYGEKLRAVRSANALAELGLHKERTMADMVGKYGHQAKNMVGAIDPQRGAKMLDFASQSLDQYLRMLPMTVNNPQAFQALIQDAMKSGVFNPQVLQGLANMDPTPDNIARIQEMAMGLKDKIEIQRIQALTALTGANISNTNMDSALKQAQINLLNQSMMGVDGMPTGGRSGGGNPGLQNFSFGPGGMSYTMNPFQSQGGGGGGVMPPAMAPPPAIAVQSEFFNPGTCTTTPNGGYT